MAAPLELLGSFSWRLSVSASSLGVLPGLHINMSGTATYVLIRCSKVTDVEDATSPPSVKVTCLATQETKTSAASMKSKRGNDYRLERPSGDLVFSLPADVVSKPVKFVVNVLCRDPSSNYTKICPGVGDFTITAVDKLKLGVASTSQTCTMYEDDMPYGEVNFTYELTSDPTKAAAAPSSSSAATPASAPAPNASASASAPTTTAAAPSPPAPAVVPLSLDTGGAAEGEGPGSAARRRRIKAPEWTTKLVPDGSKVQDVKVVEEKLNGKPLLIRAHSMAISFSSRSADESSVQASATVKLALFPVPNKQTLLRSKAISDGPDASGKRSSKLYFDFEKKSAALTIGAAEMRSRLFREGCAPRLRVEANAAGVSFTGALYLPPLLQQLHGSGQVITVPLLQCDASDVTVTASLALQILAAPENVAAEALSELQLRKAHDEYVQRNVAGNLAVTCDVLGVTGYEGLPTGLRLEASLSASAVKSSAPLDKSLSYGSGFAQRLTLSLSSSNPVYDVLEVALFKGSSPDDELARASLPLAAFECTSGQTSGQLDLRELRFFVREGDAGQFRAETWGLAASFSASAFKPATYLMPKSSFSGPAASTNAVTAAAAVAPTVAALESGTAWTRSQELDAAAALDKTSTSLIAASAPTRDSSPAVSGTLSGCVQGFVLRSGRYGLGVSDEVSADVTLLPEGLRKTVGGSRSDSGEVRGAIARTRGAGSDIAATVEFSQGKNFSMPLAWSMQQRQVSFLRVGLQVSKGGKDKPINIGSAALDLTSIVSSSYQSVTFMVPLRDRAASTSGTVTITNGSGSVPAGVTQDQDIFGWIMMSLQFNPGKAGAARSDVLIELETRGAGLWNSLQTSTLSLSSLALSSVGGFSGNAPLAATAAGASTAGFVNSASSFSMLSAPASPGRSVSASASTSAAAAAAAPSGAPPKLTTLQVVLSSLEIPPTTANAIFTQGEVISMQLRFGSDAGISALSVLELSASVVNNQVVFDRSTAIIVAPCTDELTRALSYVMYVYLLRTNPATKASRVFAEACLVVPREVTYVGLPVDLCLPTRDADGGKVCVVHLSMHESSLHTAADAEGAGPETSSSSSSIAAVDTVVRVFCDEGNVRDATWRSPIEPFFECTLIPPPQLASHPRVVRSRLQDRSDFLSPKVVTDASRKWALSCKLSLPAELLPQSQAEEAQGARWIVAIVCRDAARYGCPEIAWARVGVPWALLLRDEGIDQWVTLSPSRGASPENTSAGRVHVRVLRQGLVKTPTNNLPTPKEETVLLPSLAPAVTTNGIGTVALWLRSITELRAGNEEAQLLIASASVSSVLPNAASFDPTGLGLDDSATIQFSSIFVSSETSAAPLATAPTPAGVLSQAVPITGGDAEVRIKLSTTSSKAAFTTSFPAMSSVTRGPPEQAKGIPSLELLLSDEWAVSSGVGGGQKGPASKRPPRLRVEAAFVPFVRGTLVVTVGDIKLDPVISGKFPAGVARRAAVRAVLGPGNFTFSEPFDLADLGNNASSAQPVTTLSISVDTLEMTRGPNAVLTLALSLLDLDSVSETGSPYCLGLSLVQTAALYFQAMRNAGSASLTPSTGASVGASPNLVVQTELLDSVSRKPVGVLSVTAQFVMSGVSAGVVQSIEASLNVPAGSSTTAAAASSLTELTLKQSFKLADTDNSGSISSNELVQVMLAGRQKKGAAKPMGAGPGRGSASSLLTSTTGAVDPAEATLDLLLQLAGPEIAARITDVKNINEVVAVVFGRLDVGGEGDISWWEWKRVLSASLLGWNKQFHYCNPTDVLCVGVLAAYDAMRCSGAPTAVLSLPFVRVSIKQDGDSEAMDAAAQAFDDLPSDLPLAKAVPRLQNMVKSLRVSNNTLQKRLEKAILESQALLGGQPVGAPQAAGGAGDVGQSAVDAVAAEALVQEVVRAKQRAQAAETQQVAALKSLEFEKQRSLQLESELNKIKRSSDLTTKQMASSTAAKQAAQDKIKREIEGHNERLKIQSEQKKRKMHAAVLLAMWFRRKCFPYVRSIIRDRVKQRLAHQLTGLVARRKFVQEKKARTEAATKVQSGLRGMMGRRRVVHMNATATKMQALFRGSRAREYKRKLVVQQAAAAFSSTYRSASIVKRALYRWLTIKRAERDAAAAKIQSLQRVKIAKRETDQLRIQRAKDKERQAADAAKAKAAEAAAQREILNFIETREALRPAPDRPHCKDAVGYWLVLQAAQGEDEDAGLVVAADTQNRLVTVLYKKGIPTGDVKLTVSFDHPRARWFVGPSLYLSLSQLKAQGGSPVKPAAERDDLESDASSIELNEVPRPPLEQAKDGFIVSFAAPDAGLDEPDRVGHVRDIDVKKRLILVAFSDQQLDPTSPRLEPLPYEHPHLTWFCDTLYQHKQRVVAARKLVKQLSKVPRPTLAKAVGFTVEVISTEEEAEVGDFFVGKVVSVNRQQQTICVQFEGEEGEKEGEGDFEDLPYLSKDIAWITAPDVPVAADLSFVKRPALASAVGYSVEVRADHEEADHEDMYIGTVVRVDEKKNTFTVAFEVDADDAEAEPDEETFDYASLLVAWMAPPKPLAPPRPQTRKVKQLVWTREKVPRPDFGPGLLGHLVDVDADGDGIAQEPGKIVGLQEKRKAVEVKIDGDEEHEKMVLPWKSRDLFFVRAVSAEVEVELPIDAPAPAGTGKQLKEAAAGGDSAQVSSMAADWSWNDVLNWADKDDSGLTPLLAACSKGHVSCASILLDTPGLDVNKGDSRGSTALKWACAGGSVELASLLMKSEAVDVNAANANGETALITAAVAQKAELVAVLLQHPKIDVNKPLPDGRTPLMLACLGGGDKEVSLRAVSALLAHKSVDVNIENSDGVNALGVAAAVGNTQTLSLLLAFQGTTASPTALHAAAQMNQVGTLRLLLDQAGCQINARRSNKQTTALLVASRAGAAEAVSLLLGVAGIDVEARDSDGKTALQVAANDKVKALLRAALPAPGPVSVPVPCSVKSVPSPHDGLDQMPFILGTKPTPSFAAADRFKPGDGIDVYIDAARFLPDNCTLTRVCLKLFSSDKKPIGATYEALAAGPSPRASPVFGLRACLRQDFTPTELCLIRVDALDSLTGEAVVVGYSFLRLFSSDKGTQPAGGEERFFLNEGAFQVRVSCDVFYFLALLARSLACSLD